MNNAEICLAIWLVTGTLPMVNYACVLIDAGVLCDECN